jgi:hypothetical protein
VPRGWAERGDRRVDGVSGRRRSREASAGQGLRSNRWACHWLHEPVRSRGFSEQSRGLPRSCATGPVQRLRRFRRGTRGCSQPRGPNSAHEFPIGTSSMAQGGGRHALLFVSGMMRRGAARGHSSPPRSPPSGVPTPPGSPSWDPEGYGIGRVPYRFPGNTGWYGIGTVLSPVRGGYGIEYGIHQAPSRTQKALRAWPRIWMSVVPI